MSNTTLQWHPAFYAGVQIELCEESEHLIFENEHQLGTKPKEIDVLIIKKERMYHIQNIEHGIYYVERDYFPIQIICTKQLTDECNFWLHNLSNKINTKEQALKVIQHYEKHNNEKLYSSIVNVIINANNPTFKEVSGMCEALEKIYAEKYEAKLAEKDSTIAKKDSTIAEKDAYIAELEKKLALLTS